MIPRRKQVIGIALILSANRCYIYSLLNIAINKFLSSSSFHFSNSSQFKNIYIYIFPAQLPFAPTPFLGQVDRISTDSWAYLKPTNAVYCFILLDLFESFL